MNTEEYLEWAEPDAIRFTGLDDAIIGTDHRGNLVYDYGRMHDIFMKRDGMGDEEASDWIDYNVLGTNAGMGFTIIYT